MLVKKGRGGDDRGHDRGSECKSTLARLQRLARLEGDPLTNEHALDNHTRYLYTVADPAPDDHRNALRLLLHDTSLGLLGGDALHLAM